MQKKLIFLFYIQSNTFLSYNTPRSSSVNMIDYPFVETQQTTYSQLLEEMEKLSNYDLSDLDDLAEANQKLLKLIAELKK